MSEFLKSFVKSKTFKGIVALVAAALTAWAATGCAALGLGSVSPKSLSTLKCKARVLEPEKTR